MQGERIAAATHILPWTASQTGVTRRAVICLAASVFLALCAHVAVPHGLTGVPTTMQTFGVLLLGVVLGPTAAAAACILYLLEGATGAPVFAPPVSAGGLLHLFGPTGGYLLAYPFAAAVAGIVREWLHPAVGRFVSALVAGSLGLLPIFAGGAIWLAHSVPLSFAHALDVAVLPFLPGEALKLLLVAAVASGLQRARTSPRT